LAASRERRDLTAVRRASGWETNGPAATSRIEAHRRIVWHEFGLRPRLHEQHTCRFLPSRELESAELKKLQEIVERLKRGGPGDIVGLVENFRTGVAAYEACRTRLDAVRAETDGEIA
jgi:hypothetical protein